MRSSAKRPISSSDHNCQICSSNSPDSTKKISTLSIAKLLKLNPNKKNNVEEPNVDSKLTSSENLIESVKNDQPTNSKDAETLETPAIRSRLKIRNILFGEAKRSPRILQKKLKSIQKNKKPQPLKHQLHVKALSQEPDLLIVSDEEVEKNQESNVNKSPKKAAEDETNLSLLDSLKSYMNSLSDSSTKQTNENILNCKTCRKSFVDIRLLNEHQSNCEVCQVSSEKSTRQTTDIAIENHKAKIIFKCSFCRKMYHDKSEFSSHTIACTKFT